VYLLLKPKPQPKSKAQKQAEVIEGYKQKLDNSLAGITDKNLFIKKKTALLQSFSSELNRNLFFDEDEVRELIEKLAKYKVMRGK